MIRKQEQLKYLLKPKSSSTFKQGVVETSKEDGYVGENNVIRYMSSWELKAFQICKRLFKAGKIKGWQSEETKFQYFFELDGKYHTYFMDLTIFMEGKTIFVEIKPSGEWKAPPKKTKTMKIESYNHQAFKWVKNQNKWDAVKEWCKAENEKQSHTKYDFVIWDEFTLGIK
jgi:hypothetical protein